MARRQTQTDYTITRKQMRIDLAYWKRMSAWQDARLVEVRYDERNETHRVMHENYQFSLRKIAWIESQLNKK